MNDLHGARWIGADEKTASPVFIKTFETSEAVSARLYITGLGYFEAHINGMPVTQDRFVPAFSDYEPRDFQRFTYPLKDHTTQRIYYCSYDVTSLLQKGQNTLTVQLGNGFYRQSERTGEGETSFGTILKTIFRLVIQTENGQDEVFSDGTECWKASEIRYSNLFTGEVIDPLAARRYAVIRNVCTMEAPSATLSLQNCPPDRIMRKIEPKLLHRCADRAVYDAGENISGIVRIKSSAPRGTRITLRYAENIRPDHTLDFISAGSNYLCSSGRRQIQEDIFVTDGSDRFFEPKFVWHAFRYFEVEGSIDSAEVMVIHSSTTVTSTFSSSSEGLNFLYDSFIRTQTNNMHGSVPSDCPHRERLGYTGDGQVCAPAAMLTLDCEQFYRKWIQDILDCQDAVTGHVQHTAPFMGGGGGPGGWGCAIVLVPWYFYRHYGDVTMLKTCFMPMQKWIEYLLAHCENGLVSREEEKGWCLGDWCTLEPTRLPESFVNTCYLLKCLQLMQRIAEILHEKPLISRYAALEQQTAEALYKHFESNGKWCDSIQGADAWALWAGTGKKETAVSMNERYKALGHFDTGFLGTDILLEMLLRHGYADTAFALLESEEPGSFLYMKRNGATTIWERWTGEDSHNHPMFGACVRHLYEYFLGIHAEAPGCTQLTISPLLPKKLEWAEGSVLLKNRRVSVRWEQSDDLVSFAIGIPCDLKASFSFADAQHSLVAGKNTFVYSRKENKWF